MSLCMSYYDDDKIFVCADSRVSAQKDGKYYVVTDDYKKIRLIGNKAIFLSGNLQLVEHLFNSINEQSTIYSIQCNAKRLYKEFIEFNKDNQLIKNLKFGVELGVYIHTFEKGIPVFYQMSHDDDFEIDMTEVKTQKLFAVAAHSDKAPELVKQRVDEGISINNAILETYNQLTDEVVGGKLHWYYLQSKREVLEGQIQLKDTQVFSKWTDTSFPYHCDLLGRAKASDLELTGGSFNINDKFKVDRQGNTIMNNLTATGANISGNINMTSGSINWGNVSKPSYSASDVGALSSSSPMLTHIDAGGIYTGTLNANNINAGKINAKYIDVDSLRVNKLYNTTNPNHYAVVGGNYGDMILYANNQEFYKIYNNVDGSVTHYSYGQPFMQASGSTVNFLGDVNGVTAKFG